MSVSIAMETRNTSLVDKALLDKMSKAVHHQPARSKSNRNQLNLGVLENLIGYQLRRAQNALFQSFNKHLEHAKITPGQIGLLIKIKNNAGISQTALARANGIERSTLGEIIDRFEKRQLVDRRKHATDRRAYALHLSSQGEAFLDSVVPDLLQQEADFTQDWSEDDKQALVRLLTKLADTAV
jgi:DNA-binding MarR family transcriptional regulator